MSKTSFKYNELHELLKELDWTTWLGNMRMKYLKISIDTRRGMYCKIYDRNNDLLSEEDLLDAIKKTKERDNEQNIAESSK